MNSSKLFVCLGAVLLLFLVSVPQSLAQVPVGPDLVPPVVQLPEPPPGVKPPSVPTTTQAAPVQPSPHRRGEAQAYGAVTDQSNAVLPGATITISNATGVSQTATADGKGQYFINVAPGTYTLKISVKGFKDFTTEGLALNADQEIEMDATLEPAAASPEKVEVVGETVGHVETYNAEINETITAKQVEATPLNGRNFVSTADLCAGRQQPERAGRGSGGRERQREVQRERWPRRIQHVQR